MNLAGLIVISDEGRRLWRAARREISPRRMVRVSGCRRVSRCSRASALRAARRRLEVAADQSRCSASIRADLDTVPRVVVANPNSDDAQAFLNSVRPDIIIARCKFILKPEIFTLARVGAFALHPGICPEYRNAHGCFWALVNRDLERVGMTLLKIDKGVDTGPVYLQAGCAIDEVAESHTSFSTGSSLRTSTVSRKTLIDLFHGIRSRRFRPTGRMSAVWGQPRLTDLSAVETSRSQRQNQCIRIPAVS